MQGFSHKGWAIWGLKNILPGKRQKRLFLEEINPKRKEIPQMLPSCDFSVTTGTKVASGWLAACLWWSPLTPKAMGQGQEALKSSQFRGWVGEGSCKQRYRTWPLPHQRDFFNSSSFLLCVPPLVVYVPPTAKMFPHRVFSPLYFLSQLPRDLCTNTGFSLSQAAIWSSSNIAQQKQRKQKDEEKECNDHALLNTEGWGEVLAQDKIGSVISCSL